MTIINVSNNKGYYTQRDNELSPNSSCNVTSMIMSLSYIPKLWDRMINSSNYIKYHEKYSQPEDCLRQFMLDNNLKPTVHKDLSEGLNKFVGGFKITEFSTEIKLHKLIDNLNEGLPVVISGDFPKSNGKYLHHIVVLVGIEYDTNIYNPKYWIINDPYGDTHNDWVGSGRGIKLTNSEFKEWIKNCNKNVKWAHLFLI